MCSQAVHVCLVSCLSMIVLHSKLTACTYIYDESTSFSLRLNSSLFLALLLFYAHTHFFNMHSFKMRVSLTILYILWFNYRSGDTLYTHIFVTTKQVLQRHLSLRKYSGSVLELAIIHAYCVQVQLNHTRAQGTAPSDQLGFGVQTYSG